MLIRALLVLVVLGGGAERGWADVFEYDRGGQSSCPQKISDTVAKALQPSEKFFNSKPICPESFFKSFTPNQADLDAVTAAVIAKNGGNDTTTGGRACDPNIKDIVQNTVETYCNIRTLDPSCKDGTSPVKAVNGELSCGEKTKEETCAILKANGGNDITCGEKTEEEKKQIEEKECAKLIEDSIDPTTCPLDAAQKKQLLNFAQNGKICSARNDVYFEARTGKTGGFKTFTNAYCTKTKDSNCVISQKANGELNCEGGVSFEFLQFKDACMPCTIIEKMVEVTAGLGKKVFDGIQRGTFSLLATAVGIWLVIQVGKLLFPFGPLDRVSGIFNGVVTKLGLTLIVGTLLLSFGSYWKYIYAPVITSSINYTNVILKEANTIITGSPTASASEDPACTPSADGITIDNSTEAEEDARKIGKSITCLLKEIQATIYTGLSFSVEAMFQTIIGRNEGQPAPNNTPILGGLITFGQDIFNAVYRATSAVATVSNVWGVFVTLIGGGILILTWLPLYMNLPFRVADIVIRWTIISMLSPLMIAGAVFPATRGFMMAGLRGIVQSAFELMMIGVIMVLCTAAMQEVIELSKGDKTPFTVSSALFLQLWTIAWLANIMMGKVQSFAVAFAAPNDAQGQGLDTGVASEYAKHMEDTASKAAQKGANMASDVTAAYGQKEIK